MISLRNLATGVWLFLLLAGTQSINATCDPLFGGFYQFWQADGTTYDAHGTNNGVLQYGATYAAGKVGLAFSFDGVNDFVEVPDNNIYVSGGSFFTIEFWVRFNTVHTGTLAAPGTIFLGNDEGPGNRDKWYFGFGGGKLFFHINTFAGSLQNIAQANFSPVAGTWYHLAVVRTSFSTYKIYINGVESSSEVNTTAIPNTVATLTIGQAEGAGYLDGQMDEVTIYNVDLTQSELQAIVNAGTDGKCRYCSTPPNNMTDWWPGNGNALDVQGTNSGSLVGGASYASAGFVGEAFQFDGVNDAVTTTRTLPFNQFSNMTWECWVFPTQTNYSRQQIISIDDGGYDFSLLMEGNTFAVFTGTQSWVPVNQAITLFEWHHIAAVFTYTNVEFYHNGTRYSFGSPAVYSPTGSTLEFGRNPNQAFGEYFKGMIDEVSIYNRALNLTEIQQIYAGANSGKCRVTTAGARIEASPQILNFGTTTIGQTNELTLVVQNTGSATLTNLLTISNTVFSIGSPGTSFTVPTGGSQVVKVRFIPVTATSSPGALTITHNDPSRPSIVITLSGLGEPPAVCLPPPGDLVSWWRAENFSADDARGGNNGTLSNGVGFIAGKVGMGFNFNGPNTILNAPTNGISLGSADFTVEGWIKAEPGNGTRTIISFGGAFYTTLYLFDDEGRLVMWPRNGTPSGNGFKDGQWHHFAVTRQGNGLDALKYYKDGVFISSEISPYDLVGTRCYIGWDLLPGQVFVGGMDEISFYNRALSGAEVAAIFNARSAGKCFDPLGNAPDISVTPTNLNFGDVIIGSGATLNLTVSNLGVGPLTINAGTFSNARFSIAAGTFPLGIAPGADQTIIVQFSPTNLTAQSGTLTLVNNDPDEGSFVVPLTGQGATCPGLPPGAVSWWRADNNTLDSTGPNHGTNNGATFATGMVGQAFNLDGVVDRVDVPTNELNFRTGDFTAEGWVKTTSTKDYNAIFTFDSYNPAIYVRYYGAIQLYPSAASSTTGFNDGLFHHFAVVRQSGTVTYYKDGVTAGTAASSTDINPTFAAIGTSRSSYDENFPGLIDELTFYNRALSGGEVAAIFTQGSDGKCSGGGSPGTNTNGTSIELSLVNLDFGYVGVGQSNQITLTVSNSGSASLVISNIFPSNPRFNVISPTTNSINVATGAQQLVTIRFTPAGQGLEVGFLALSNNSAHGTFYVPIRGIGAPASRPAGGTVYGWGDNFFGSELMDTTAPFPIAGGALTGKVVTAISSLDEHNLAVDSAGRVFAWGTGDDGELGNGTNVEYEVFPVAVNTNGALFGKKVIDVAAGGAHSLALTADGRVYSWGGNGLGGLGIGSNLSRTNMPTEIKMNGALAGKRITAISAGATFTLALGSDGKVYAWGNGFSGELGTGSTASTNAPVAVNTSGVLNGKTVIAISAGRSEGFALTSEGRVYSWGEGSQGVLGNGGSVQSLVPVAVDTGGALNGKTVVAISAGGPGGMALTSEGKVYDWGRNFSGELGTGSPSPTSSAVPVPVSVSGALAGKTIVGVMGGDVAMALSVDGKVFTWGDNFSGGDSEGGALGTGISYRVLNETNAPVAVDTTGYLSRQAVIGMATGYRSGLVIATPDTALVAPEIELNIPAFTFGQIVPSLTGDLSIIVSNAGNASLAVSSLSNSNPGFSVIGNNSFSVASGAAQAVTLRFAPTALGVQFNVLQINSNDTNEPALFIPLNGVGASTGSIAVAWGDNTSGNLGLGMTNAVISSPTNVNVSGILAGKSIAMVAGGGGHSLALATDGNIYAWGLNNQGQLGNDTRNTSPPLGVSLPVAVNMGGALAGKTVIAVAAGNAFSAALTADGKVFVWGENNDGEAGNDLTDPFYTTPTIVNMNGALAGKVVVAIACGGDNMLALTADGKVFGWGASDEGQVGDGTFEDRRHPVAVEGMLFGKTIVEIRAGGEFGYALDASGNVYAWGNDSTGGTPGTESGGIPIPFPVAVDRMGALTAKRVVEIGAGENHSLALAATGEPLSWGFNGYGQLGAGVDLYETNAPLAVKTTGALAGKSIVTIEGGLSDSTLALASDGSLFAWGLNDAGQLGNGTNCPSGCNAYEAVAVRTNSALAGKVILGLGAGSSHHLAIVSSSGSVTNPAPDIAVSPTNVNFGTITVGTTNQLSIGITNVGAAMLTVNSMVISNSATFSFIAGSIPFSLNPGESIVMAVQFRPATVGTHNGSLTIGSNDPDEASLVIPLTGQATGSSVPNISVSPGSLNFGTVAVGQTNSLSLQVNNSGAGTLNVSSLAVSNTTFSLGANPAPFNLPAGATTNISVRYHPQTTTNYFGTLTIGSSDPDEPSRVVQLTGSTLPPTNIPASLVAWGENFFSVFGNGGGYSSSVPVTVTTNGALSGKTIIALDAGSYHSLALASDGKVFGWGYNVCGQIGDGTYNEQSYAVPMADGALAGRAVSAIAARGVYSLALATDGTVYSWGYNAFGQLGDGTYLTRAAPVAVNASGALNGKTVIAIAAGGEHALALTSDRRIFAWGRNPFGQLGNGGIPTYTDAGNTNVPTAVVMSGALNGKTVVAIAAGTSHSMALTTEGKVYAWGYGNTLGNPNYYFVESTVPVPVSTSGVLNGKYIVAIDAGAGFSVALASDGTAYTWGDGDEGQLGNGTTVDFTNVPVAVNMNGVLAGKQLVAVKAGEAHVLAIASDGKMYSWGRDAERQLGNGDAPGSNVPVAVDMSGILAGKTISAIASASFHNLAAVGPIPTLPVPAVLNAQRSGQTLTLSWSTNLNAQLQTTSSFVAPWQWVTATNQVTIVGNQKTVSIQPSGVSRLFRLLLQ